MASAAGDRILIKPGEYDESLTIDKDLQIHGDGQVEEIIMQSADAQVISLLAGRGQISNLTIRQTASQDTNPEADKIPAAVQIKGGQPVIQNCDISSDSGCGITIQGNADPAVRACRIHDNKQHGVYVAEQGRGTFEDNDISANTWSGVIVTSGGDPAVRACRIHDNKQHGVYVAEQGRGTFEDNDISANTWSGVIVTSGGDPAVRACRIHDNKQHGVYVCGAGAGHVRRQRHLRQHLLRRRREIRRGSRRPRLPHPRQQAAWRLRRGAGAGHVRRQRHLRQHLERRVIVTSGGDPAVRAAASTTTSSMAFTSSSRGGALSKTDGVSADP